MGIPNIEVSSLAWTQEFLNHGRGAQVRAMNCYLEPCERLFIKQVFPEYSLRVQLHHLGIIIAQLGVCELVATKTQEHSIHIQLLSEGGDILRFVGPDGPVNADRTEMIFYQGSLPYLVEMVRAAVQHTLRS